LFGILQSPWLLARFHRARLLEVDPVPWTTFVENEVKRKESVGVVVVV
jgi:hypothetical protein